MARTKVMMTNDDPVEQSAATKAEQVAVQPETAPIAAPMIALDGDGVERPLSGGSFVMINGKLVREEEA